MYRRGAELCQARGSVPDAEVDNDRLWSFRNIRKLGEMILYLLLTESPVHTVLRPLVLEHFCLKSLLALRRGAKIEGSRV